MNRQMARTSSSQGSAPGQKAGSSVTQAGAAPATRGASAALETTAATTAPTPRASLTRASFLALAAGGALATLAGCALPGGSGGTSGSSSSGSNAGSGAGQASGGTSSGGGSPSGSSSAATSFAPSSGRASATLRIASGSENKEAADAIQHACDASGVAVELTFMGSLDIMAVLKDGGRDYDAVWPASSIWVTMGDEQHVVKDAASTSTTPVVFGVARSKAEELGWVAGATDSAGTTGPAGAAGSTTSAGADGVARVSTADIIAAVQAKKLTFAMTSATQSNSGASAYLAFLSALAGHDGPLTEGDLANDNLTSQVSQLLAGVDRSSGSSDWLKDMVVNDPQAHQAMVNYESLVIQADKQLTSAGNEPLMVVYPQDGIAVSDSPLGYVDRGQNLHDAFSKFQQALSDDDARLAMERVGRRTGLGGKLSFPDDGQVKDAFRAEWGVTTDASVLRSVTMPAADVMQKALQMYQGQLRKASFTAWVVDYSGSMAGEGKQGVVAGLQEALDPTKAAASMIQPADGDVNVLVAFSGSADAPLTARGTDTAALLAQAEKRAAIGGTDIYAGLLAAWDQLPPERGSYTVAVVLMTDGQSMTDNRDRFLQRYDQDGGDVPIFSIMFGDADPTQLDDLSRLSNGKTFDGRTGSLADVFRQVKGYN